MKKKTNQRGVAHLAAVLAVVVLAFAGFAGWWVWQKNSKKSSPNNSAQNTTSQNEQGSEMPVEDSGADPTDSWIVYTNTEGQFSLKYPPSWKLPSNLEYCEGGGLMIGPDEETVGKCQSDNTRQITVGSQEGDDRLVQQPPNTDIEYEVTEKLNVTVRGVSGTKTSSTTISDQSLYPVGTKHVGYKFYTNGRTYQASYIQWPGDPDNLAIFETIVEKTLKFTAE